ncbi:unnamed protein product [Rotaria socialis]|uniref:Cilia-and flagella-associated protein 96 n=1 Tax=Rotaria socialis TaxID=392032 RepID=A0A821TEU2_9BILA|nr:unnamed protein product [Rotaria socialis]
MGTTKNDMERVGLFKEMEYVSIKDPYKESAKFAFNEAANKNKQMMSKSSKERSTGSMAGYFDKDYKILPASYVDPVSLRRKARLEEKKKNIVTKPFVSMYRARSPPGSSNYAVVAIADHTNFILNPFFPPLNGNQYEQFYW